MAPNPGSLQRIRQYLLGQISEEVSQEVEQNLLTDDELFEELLVTEDELIDEYLNDKLPADERERFEKQFLSTSERHQKLRFGRAFQKYLSAQAARQQGSSPTAREGSFALPAYGAQPGRILRPASARWPWAQAFFSSPLRIAACALVVLGVAFGVWRVLFHQSDVYKGLVALNAAYREQRPVEARISTFSYAPFPETRGSEPERFDSTARDRAERTLLDAANDSPGPASYHALGKLYLSKKQFDKAIEQFDKALKGDPRNAQLLGDLGAALLEKGKIDRHGTEPGKGLEELARSLENLNKALELNGNLLEALFNRALVHQHLMLPNQAEDDWREYLKKDSTSPWADEARRNLKSLEEARSRNESPPQILERFIDAHKRNDDQSAWQIMSQTREMITGKMIAFQLVQRVLSEVRDRRNSKSESLQLLVYAGSLERENSGDPYMIDLAHYYATSSKQQRKVLIQAEKDVERSYQLCLDSKYADAMTLFIKAKTEFMRAADTLEAKLQDYWIAYCESQIDRIADSISVLTNLEVYSRTLNYIWVESQALYLLGNGYGLLGQNSESIAYGERALELAAKLSDTYNQQKIRGELAWQYTHIARPQRGLALINENLLQPISSLGSLRQTWRDLKVASEIFYSLRLYDAAAGYEQEALSLVQTLHWSASLAHISEIHLGMIYSEMKRYEDASRHVEESLRLANSLREDPSSLRMISYSTLETAHLKRQTGDHVAAIKLYDDAISLYDQMEFDIDKYDAHKGRLLCYLATRSDAEIENELHVLLRTFEEHRARILEEQNRNAFFDREQSVYDLAIGYEWEKGRYEQAFDYSEMSRARSLLDALQTGTNATKTTADFGAVFSSATKPSSLQILQSRIPERVQVIEYAVLNDRVLIWLITRTSFKFFETRATSVVLRSDVVEYLNLIRKMDRSHDELRARAVKLYELLISPVADDLDRSRQLCIVPDKMLFQLPFATLVSRQTGNYLLTDYQLFLSPSLNTLLLCSESADKRLNSSAESLLIVGNPAFDHHAHPELVDLPAAEREARTIADGYQNAIALVGADAVKETVESRIPRADVVHFACHYLPDTASPMSSRLVLAPSSPERSADLLAYEVMGMKLQRSRLVVLSACDSGIEGYYEGEGMTGMARTFIASGVPLVVATQWPVDSEATAELMILFHRHRHEGSSTVAALRRAQLDLIGSTDRHYVDPYYWAAFSPIGGYAQF